MAEEILIKKYGDVYSYGQEINFSNTLNSAQFKIPFVIAHLPPFAYQITLNSTTYHIYGPFYFVLKETAIKLGARWVEKLFFIYVICRINISFW